MSSNSVRCAILDAIDTLRGRRFRPDKNRIIEIVSKNEKVSRKEILQELSKAVDDDAVIKVRYKEGFSYRNPDKMSLKGSGTATTDEDILEVQRNLNWVLKIKAESGDQSSFSMTYLLDKIRSNDPTLKVNDVMLEDLMEEEVTAG